MQVTVVQVTPVQFLPLQVVLRLVDYIHRLRMPRLQHRPPQVRYNSAALLIVVGSSGLSGPAIGGIVAACVVAGIVMFTFVGGLIYRRRVRKQEEVELKNRDSDTTPFSANLRYPSYYENGSRDEVPSARLQDNSDAAIKKHDVTKVPIAHIKPNPPEHGFRFD